ncbi:uncharacterized protein LOC112521129 [Cynara cardunculus var. scolymus]|uniref:uncharacterized protein LOC112521129 n=1 Tax=Cynara cardunculus var. scolymus TaxID=59895 RepID=UPI000D624BA5|nr:uncharacterized protein LOC112521129 [Cynara cardunculus var. scolymus]
MGMDTSTSSFAMIHLGVFILLPCLMATSSHDPTRWDLGKEKSSPPLRLLTPNSHHVILDNGLLKLKLSTPAGMIVAIHYNGTPNLLESGLKESQRGYWDLVWSRWHDRHSVFDVIHGTSFDLISKDENHIEVSFLKTWKYDNKDDPPIKVDKRYVMLRGCSGFYSYAIYQHLEEWPDIDIEQTRLAFKLDKTLFNYMAISDDRQRMMPTGKERAKGRKLDYPEAVRLPNNLSNPLLRGEVDDKYQYSASVKDSHIHGWISGKLRIGFWLITPSSEFRAGGPLKQELTSHVGPTTLSTFFSCHYTGSTLAIKLKYGEYWKKVYGPVFVYLNSGSVGDDYRSLWDEAKKQASIERRTWPYDFPRSQDYPHAYQRGTVIGRMLVQDRYVSKEALIVGNDAYVGLAPEGEAGSWQKNSKGYQFWNQSDDDGYFVIRGIRSGSYNLYYWIPGFIGDSKYSYTIHISEGDFIKLGDVVYEAPRNGPTLWEIGIPDRTAAEFYVPDPYPNLVNHLFMNHTNDRFRQYGLWDRYTDLYPENDLVYNVGASDYRKDWFFAHVNRKLEDGSYGATTWRIVFNLTNVSNGSYTLWLALATANGASIKVNFNEQPNPRWLSFRTGLIGRDNAIARHGIHGFYRLYSFNVPSFLLGKGANVISLHQENGRGKFYGVMYDYIRFEGPPEIDLIFNLKN